MTSQRTGVDVSDMNSAVMKEGMGHIRLGCLSSIPERFSIYPPPSFSFFSLLRKKFCWDEIRSQ